MIILIEGDVGSGKSLLCVVLAKTLNYKYVYANFDIKIKNFKKFSVEDFYAGKISNSLIIVDEAYTIVDSRSSMNRSNIDMTTATFQSRKMKCDLVYVSQLFSTFDMRLRDLCSARISCEFDESRNSFVYTLFKKARMNESIIFKKLRSISLSYKNAQQFFGFYNTFELIQTDSQKNMLFTEKDIEKLVDEVRNELKKRNMKKSKDFVRFYLREKKIVYSQVIDRVYYSL